MKNLIFLTFLASPALVPAVATAAPAPGDLAFVAFNADEDGFAITSFVDLAAGEQLFVTDKEWNALPVQVGGDFTAGEGVLAWTLDTGLTAGSVVRFSAVNSSADVAVSTGSIARSGSFSLATKDESVILYRAGTSGPIPLAALGMGGGLSGQLLGAGLDAATTAFSSRVDFAEYVGPRSGLGALSDYGPLVFDAGQWLARSATDEAATVPDLTAFTAVAAPVPEPGSYAMFLGGLGLLTVMARRRRAV
ncbi:PEP-CTERM sorting domain-containing protein [Nitrogeniibacter mangrovi]|uniref:PEP-CTERM sorting domain-containing protein n=1 Tax=Nitrogeniibacter mangrovi TaxID=2016596 RepID=A0A6C1AZI7_9RHOO|nr:PEP-CTERM sorting domain-containing protein [Nitrogeniibacter mangrovi]QID16781.1 PEP-CTERM sorting domain-containing protein [Nitrogeniibacter mangrovi]